MKETRTTQGLSEDWTAVLLGVSLLLLALLAAWVHRPASFEWGQAKIEKGVKWDHPGKSVLGMVGGWSTDPRNGLLHDGFEPAEVQATDPPKPKVIWPKLAGMAMMLAILGSIATLLRGLSVARFLRAFPALFLLALLANLIATQKQVSDLKLEYVLWALLLGLIISNSIGTPRWLRPAVLGEQYIKLGLVLFGVEVLLATLLKYGVPGVFVAWVVTPVVLVLTYLFGQHILKLRSKTLNIVISADMSVCGVSAAIATAAACRAKREELSLAIGLSMAFTVVMMIVLPKVCVWLQLPNLVAGAWIGGTIDSSGAVAAAGAMLGEEARDVAITIKLIQNTLIGVVAFSVAAYWVAVVERQPSLEASESDEADRVTPRQPIGIQEIWLRFPKFVLGFIGVSLVASLLVSLGKYESLAVDSVKTGVTKPLREWLFCLAFVCIGLESNFRQFLPHLRSGKPVVLYVVGQSLNLVLTFLMAYLMFGWLFPDIAEK